MGKSFKHAATLAALLGLVAPAAAEDAAPVVVKPGDTLTAIAQDKGVSVEAIVKANPQISNPNLIMPGQVVAGAGSSGDEWLRKVARKLFKDLTGKDLPAEVGNDPEKMFKEFKKENVAKEGGMGPSGAVVFFATKLGVSNGDGTVIGTAADGTLDPRVRGAGSPLGYAVGAAAAATGGGGGTGSATGTAAGSGGTTAGGGGGGGAPSGGGGEAFTGGSTTKIPDKLKEIIIRALKANNQPVSWADTNGLAQILYHESSFNSTAQNPTSTAYGLFQFLDSTWAGVGGHKTSDPYLQCVYGLKYIQQRYGTPDKAWAFWQAHNWY